MNEGVTIDSTVRPRLHAGFVCSALLAGAIAFGQTRAEEPIKVVTVCDILLGGAEFNGKTVAVLGRFAGSDEGQWLVEDECGRKVEVNGVVRESSVWLVPRSSPFQANSGTPPFDQDSLKAKLSQVGKTTKLGKHVQYQCTLSTNGGKPECGWPELPDQWAIAYGKVETIGDSRSGFGHLGGSPAQLFAQGVLVFIDENGRLRR
jgi:hypothetical protein